MEKVIISFNRTFMELKFAKAAGQETTTLF